MDKTGIIIVSICAALLVFWFVKEQKQEVHRLEQQQQFALTNKVAVAKTQEASPTALPATSNVAVPFETNAPESLIVLSNAEARYTFTSRGGGLKLVELLHYPETISPRWKENSATTNAVASLNTHAPVPVLAILGDTNLVGNGNFILTRLNDGVRAEKILPDGLRLVKEFHIGTDYLVNASVRLENTSDKPLTLPAQELTVGTATPMDADDNYFRTYGGVMWFDGKNPQNCSVSYFNTNNTVLGIFHRTVHDEYREGAGNVVWAAAHNQYFTLLAMPKEPATQIVARPVTLPPLAENSPSVIGIQTALVYPPQTLAANSNIVRQITFYIGPKEYRLLVQIGQQFKNHADLVMNFGTGFAGFWGIGPFFAKLLLSAMNWLHDVTKFGYGWLIVLLTIILRAIFWPLTAASIRSAKKMQALAPQVNALREKYKDEPQKFTQKQLELWRENKVSPMSGCLPVMVQMPVFIGFYTMLRSAIELRGAHFLWVADLSKPDTLFIIPGLNFPFNLLPLLMVGVMVWQAHLQPPSPGMDPSQQKMMRFMPLIFLVFLYFYSSGMALYMTVSTLASVVQNWLTRGFKPAPVTTPLTPPQKKRK